MNPGPPPLSGYVRLWEMAASCRVFSTARGYARLLERRFWTVLRKTYESATSRSRGFDGWQATGLQADEG